MKASKLTARSLAYALRAVGRKIAKKYRASKTPHGKQSVKKLMAHGVATNSIELSGDTKTFDRVARKWNVDYAFYKAGPDKYLLFFKSGQADAMAYIKNEADILKFVDTLIANTKGDGKEGDPFWTKAETLLYCALIAYIIFEGAPADRNMNTLVDMISGMEVKEDDEDFLNPVDYMFMGLEKRKPDCFAVKQYKKYKLASGVICSK